MSLNMASTQGYKKGLQSVAKWLFESNASSCISTVWILGDSTRKQVHYSRRGQIGAKW